MYYRSHRSGRDGVKQSKGRQPPKAGEGTLSTVLCMFGLSI